MAASLLLRLVALFLGLLYLPLGTVWAWWVALLVLPLAFAGLWLLRVAEQKTARAACRPAERWIHLGALTVIGLGFGASALSLALTA